MTLHISEEMLILINLGKVTLKAWAKLYAYTYIRLNYILPSAFFSPNKDVLNQTFRIGR